MMTSSDHLSIPTEDSFSSLPDSILSHILSFLPTKSAAATSVLSRRWKPLWLSLFDLDYDHQTVKNLFTFLPCQIVDHVIARYDTTNTIIPCCNDNINETIIDAVFQRGTQTLELHMVHRLNLTRSIFTCRTLTFLKLKNLCVNYLPPLVNVPLLKTLHLQNVYFTTQSHIFKFLLGCPILEELKLDHVIVLPPTEITSNNECLPSLARLVRATMSDYLPIPFSLFSGVQILSIKSMWHIYTQVPTFHNLTQMQIFFFNFKGTNWINKWNWMLEMLQRSPKLQDLIIHQEMEDEFYVDNWQDPHVVPECLSSQLRTCWFRDWRGRPTELQFLRYVVQNSTVLHTVTINCAKSIDSNGKLQTAVEVFSFHRASLTFKVFYDF